MRETRELSPDELNELLGMVNERPPVPVERDWDFPLMGMIALGLLAAIIPGLILGHIIFAWGLSQ